MALYPVQRHWQTALVLLAVSASTGSVTACQRGEPEAQRAKGTF
jgi:hypothetical protein